ncbi:hypothetical protein EU244_025175 [Rhodococcus qingshengii]|uniref:hypothetical protein n=1 Tax=Rhodococcus qingshengii TaxID=334542 RepID=UPI0010A5ACEC|nr:hypothetical protein [Rhodococcus qingshengii]THJ70700.1 hypothetical protein EU244_15285 [Rhodococcus qingshengii]
MTLTEAIVCIGKPVIYTHPATLETEPGIIRSVDRDGRQLVNVQYGASIWATHPDNLMIDWSRR